MPSIRTRVGASDTNRTKGDNGDSKKTTGTPIRNVTREERYRMICETAYYRAQKRNFKGGDAVQDWLVAEKEVDSRLTNRS